MEWVLIVSVLWASTRNSVSTTNVIEGFASESLCRQAEAAMRDELRASLGPRIRVQSYGRLVCVQRKGFAVPRS
jgi:hypothetical protein